MVTQAEALLALRDPGADWLATLVTALDQAQSDPEFSRRLTGVFADLAQQASIDGRLAPAIVEAANRRTQDFTNRLTDEIAQHDIAPLPEDRPALTLVSG